MEELPLGFSMALAQHPEAMARFAALTEAEQQAIISGTHSVHSKQEMQAYVERLMKCKHAPGHLVRGICFHKQSRQIFRLFFMNGARWIYGKFYQRGVAFLWKNM